MVRLVIPTSIASLTTPQADWSSRNNSGGGGGGGGYGGSGGGYGGSGGGYGGSGGGYGSWGGGGDKMSNLGGGLRTIDWNTQNLTKFEKNFYREDPRVSARSEREVEEFRRLKEMKVCSHSLYDTTTEAKNILGPRQQYTAACNQLR